MKPKTAHFPREHRLLNLYSALSACDSAIIRKSSRADLFDEICRNIVEMCDMDLVWIGLLEGPDPHIRPVAHCGQGWSYLEWIKLTVAVDRLPGQGAAGIAVRENRAVWSADMASDPLMAGIRDLAAFKGWHSAAVLPLVLGGVAMGALSIYARAVQGFCDQERRLLLQLASNISYALDFFELEVQRKQAQYALLESEVRYSALFSNNGIPMLVIDPVDGRIVDANIKAIGFYGWSQADLTSMQVTDINAMQPEQVRREMAQAASTKKGYFEFQHRLANGDLRDVEVFSSPISFGGKSYLISAVHDVTQRRRLEARVRNAQSLTQRFIDHLPGTAFVKDSQLRLLIVNQHLGNLLGVDPASLIGKTAHDIFPPEFAAELTELDLQMLRDGGSRTFEESLNGRHNDTSLFVIDDVSGERLLAGLSFDVTDRYRFMERSTALLQINDMGSRLPEKDFLTAGLELAEKLTRSKTGFLHCVTDDQETLDNDDVNCPVRYGLPLEPVGMSRLVSAPIIESGKVRMVMGVGNKESDYDDFDVNTLLLMGNDMWRIVQRARVEISLQQRVAELVVVNEKLSQTQTQLLQSEKMASIGQLASGVAHEINNPIGFVKSNLGSLSTYVDNLLAIVNTYETVEKQLGESFADRFAAVHERKLALDYDYLTADLPQLIAESREGVQRVSQIVLDLKNFSRAGDETKEWSDLQAGIESTINVVWNQLKYKAEVIREYANLPPVYCIAAQINQVVMNLLVNAGQAIEGRGHISIRTGQQEQVWVEVQDDGCGIPAHLQAQVFEPFYTTKPVGQGTGLGACPSPLTLCCGTTAACRFNLLPEREAAFA
ncbi:MAG: GAF domain-containing protein [Rhodoferax sp.]